MRFSLFALTAIISLASAGCTPGHYACGTGSQANEVKVCGADGNFQPFETCQSGTVCKEYSGNSAVCAQE